MTERELSRRLLAPLSRRDYMRQSAAAALAALTGAAPRLLANPSAANPQPKADSIILLWMAGGMAQTETFDPKRYTPYRAGLESQRVLSTFPAIPTSVDGIQFSQGLEELAK
ncbi:MAG: DUF1501 domain-containing protein, partial [Bryobacterales bacterium]|nr:DUF1501 domain-containing protein [Bryobacterales bacterium]